MDINEATARQKKMAEGGDYSENEGNEPKQLIRSESKEDMHRKSVANMKELGDEEFGGHIEENEEEIGPVDDDD